MVKWSKTHLRSPDNRYMSLCGQGYNWPSSIDLTDDIDKVDCDPCREKHQGEK